MSSGTNVLDSKTQSEGFMEALTREWKPWSLELDKMETWSVDGNTNQRILWKHKSEDLIEIQIRLFCGDVEKHVEQSDVFFLPTKGSDPWYASVQCSAPLYNVMRRSAICINVKPFRLNALRQ